MKNRFLAILFISNGVFVFANGLLGPLYALFVETIDSRLMAVSISWAVYLIASSLIMIVMRSCGDKVRDKKLLLMIGYLVKAIVWALFPLVGSIYYLLLFQALLGVADAVGSPAYDALFAEHLDKGKHVREYTDWKLISSLAQAMSVLAGGVIVSVYGYAMLFYLMSVLAMVAFMGIYLVKIGVVREENRIIN